MLFQKPVISYERLSQALIRAIKNNEQQQIKYPDGAQPTQTAKAEPRLEAIEEIVEDQEYPEIMRPYMHEKGQAGPTRLRRLNKDQRQDSSLDVLEWFVQEYNTEVRESNNRMSNTASTSKWNDTILMMSTRMHTKKPLNTVNILIFI